MNSDLRPIGLFDSGVGGLTVLKLLVDHFPHENFVYLGDTARLPYGSKSQTTISHYVAQNIEFLMAQNVKAIVIACNSASTVMLGHTDFAVPVYNVIEPGASTAVRASQMKRIGVMGTRATVSTLAYVRAIHALSPDAEVFQVACPLLVPLVEEGWEDDPITNLIVYRYVSPLVAKGIDTLVLGCTHYPALGASIQRAVGTGVTLVHSAGAIIETLEDDFKSGKLSRRAGSDISDAHGARAYFATDTSSALLEVARRLMAPYPILSIQHIDLAKAQERPTT